MIRRWDNASHGFITIKSMSNCITKWTLKIHGTINGCNVIGITSIFDRNTPFQWDHDKPNYSYLGDSGDVGNTGKWHEYDKKINEPDRHRAFKENDIIQIILDLNKRTISFTKNGKEFGVAWKDIPEKPDLSFKLVISVRNAGDGATIMDFQQIFPKKSK